MYFCVRIRDGLSQCLVAQLESMFNFPGHFLGGTPGFPGCLLNMAGQRTELEARRILSEDKLIRSMSSHFLQPATKHLPFSAAGVGIVA